MRRSYDVLIVGGGVIGLSCAYYLSSAGARVLVLERGRVGAEASWAAAGMLAVQHEADGADPFANLCRASRDQFAGLSAALRDETGIDIEYDTTGAIEVAHTDDELAALAQKAARLRGIGLVAQTLARAAARELEPLLGEAVAGGVLFPEDHQVNNRAFVDALHAACRGRGVEIREYVEAVDWLRAGDGRVDGVRTAGESFSAGSTVLAAGAWTGPLAARLGIDLPVEPVYGQLVEVRPRTSPRRILFCDRTVYVVPKRGGRLIVGTTVARRGYEKRPTAGDAARLLGAAIGLVPSLAEAEWVTTWAGLRPGSPDGRPILGPVPDLPGLLLATGHFRNGILLAPITGMLISALARGEPAPCNWRPFALKPERWKTEDDATEGAARRAG